jgi:putative Ca2+/H+ antiporter (TMEM165/GDT1 family)
VNWKLLGSTFGAVFLAELGDKTQLATVTFAAGGSSKLAVFLGAAGALVASSAIAVGAGEALSKAVPLVWLKRGAGVIFLVLGVLYLMSKAEPPPT